jgi:hypothetical protein
VGVPPTPTPGLHATPVAPDHGVRCALRLATPPTIVGTDEEYVPNPRSVATTSGPGADAAWYTDSSATYHITSELDRLTMHEPYTGTDQIYVANGSGMGITRISTSNVPTAGHDLVLKNVLHVPFTHNNLIFVHHFTLDDDTFIKFHPYFFLNKE